MESERLDDVLRRVEQSLDEQDSFLIRRVFESYAYVSDIVEDKNTSIHRLRELFFGPRTEKTGAITGQKTRKPEADSSADSMAEIRSAEVQEGMDDLTISAMGHITGSWTQQYRGNGPRELSG